MTMYENKQKIHICMLHPQIQNVKELYEVLHLDCIDKLPFRFIWDESAPQFIIATELIYTDSSVRKRFRELYNDHVVTIFFAGECVFPDLNLFDYALCFEDFGENDRVIDFSHRNFYRKYITKKQNELENNYQLAKNELSVKSAFCNFIYSNPNGHRNREKIFHMLDSYKKVDSFGAFLNNTGFRDTDGLNMMERVRNSTAIKSRYKFTIAFENATHRGYTSEKIFTSLEAHSIPIYWGNPEIGKIVNEKAFINCHCYENFQQVLDRVKEIDQDDTLWCQMISEPWLTKEQEEEEKRREKDYYDFLNKIFMQDPSISIKRGSGTFTNLYIKFFFDIGTEYEKSNINFQLSIKWICLHHQNKCLGDFFNRKKYNTVAIYGMGNIGVLVYEEILKCTDIKNVYGIDKGIPTIPDYMRSLRLYEIDDVLKPDIIIVTVLWDIVNIREELNRLFKCDIYGIHEIIDDVLRKDVNRI